MKKPSMHMLCPALCLFCLLALVACGGGRAPESKPTPDIGDTTVQQNSIADFVKANQAVLEETVRYITSREGLSYFYFIEDASSGTVYIEEQIAQDGALIRQPFTHEVLDRLAAVGFTGQLSFNSAREQGIVSFQTTLHNGKGAFVLAYCPDDAAVDYISDGYFINANHIKVEPIVDRWYYVEVT